MIAIIDYGLGNLRSVQKGFEHVGHSAEITKDPQRILKADAVVLPGVGAFSDAMDNLRELRLIPIIKRTVIEGKNLLGICLGMQLFMNCSYEGGVFQGLGLIPGEVRLINKYKGLKVPHMGWNELNVSNHPLFAGIRPKANVYFVHSYHVVADKNYVIGTTNYGSIITAAVANEKILGLQFHPEKSGDNGLMILKNFGNLI